MKKKITKIASILMTALFILSTLAVLGSCSNDKTSSKNKETKKYSAGEESSIGHWKVKPASVEFSQSLSIGNNLSTTLDDGKKYGIVKMTVTNTGDEDDFFCGMAEIDGELVIRLICDGEEFKPSLTMNNEDDLISCKVAPDGTKDGFLAFIVTDKAAGAKECALRISLGDKVVEYDLGK